MRRPRLRLTIAGMLILVALIAVGIAYFRPRHTEVEDVKVGTGPAVKSGDLVTVHYVGMLTDGKKFDSSRPRGQPFAVQVGTGRVIRGWDIGLIGMKAGGVRRLTIPPDEAYGEKGVPPVIPPNSTLRFEVELWQVAPAASGILQPYKCRRVEDTAVAPGLEPLLHLCLIRGGLVHRECRLFVHPSVIVVSEAACDQIWATPPSVSAAPAPG